MKKRLIALAVTAAFITAAFPGCRGTAENKGEAETSAAGPGGTDSAGVVTEAGEFPIVKETVELNVLVQQSATTNDFEQADQTKYTEEKTGIKLKFTVLPSTSDAAQKLKLILSGGNLPDVFFNIPGMTGSDVYSLAQHGTFIALDDYIEKYGVETKKMFESVPYAKDLITYPDGKIYSLPYINDCYHCNVLQRMFIYKPWLDKLNLNVPTTTDELYDVLKAFKERDPNGNKKQDEIPLSGNNSASGNNSSSGLVQSFLMNAFTYFSVNNEYYVDDGGKVIMPYDSADWKDGLTYMHKLYKEGIIAPESFTQSETQLKSIVMSDEATVGAFTSRFSHTITGWDTGTIGTLSTDYVVVPPLTGPKGYQGAVWRPYSSSNSARFMISSTCKNPEAAFRLGDHLLSQEQTEISLMGLEGKGWKRAEADEVGIDGRPAVYHQIPEASSIPNQSWGIQLPMVATNDIRMSMAATGGAGKNLEVSLYEMTKIYEPFKVDRKNVIPNLYFTDDQVTRLSDLSQITRFVDEATARFITGDLDLNGDWDKYINELNAMGYKEYQEIYQEAYDKVKNNLEN